MPNNAPCVAYGRHSLVDATSTAANRYTACGTACALNRVDWFVPLEKFWLWLYVHTSSAHKAATRMYAACMQVCLHTSSHFSTVSKADVFTSGNACRGVQKKPTVERGGRPVRESTIAKYVNIGRERDRCWRRRGGRDPRAYGNYIRIFYST